MDRYTKDLKDTLDRKYNDARREAETIGAAYEKPKEFKERDNERIREKHKEMKGILSQQSKENQKKVAYIKAGRTNEERKKRYVELVNKGLMKE